MLLDDSDFNERSLSVARGSREIRMWEKFFETSVFHADDEADDEEYQTFGDRHPERDEKDDE